MTIIGRAIRVIKKDGMGTLFELGSNEINRVAREKVRRTCGKFDKRALEVLADEEVEKNLKAGKKTVLYVARKYNYGNENWGLSNQHYIFYNTLLNMDYSLIHFDYGRLTERYGPKKMSQILREAVYYYSPDILFDNYTDDWIDHDVLKEISNELPTKTVIYLFDDHFLYESSRPTWELFNLVVTTDPESNEKRKQEGFKNVLLTRCACNPLLWRDLNIPRIYDVTFIGQCYGDRKFFVNSLRKDGVNVQAFGQRWANSGRITQAEMIKIYNRSKITLGMSAASSGGRSQIKGRDLEAPCTKSLLLTNDTKEIAEYFIPGEEIVTYRDVKDASEKIKYYLAHEEERARIAQRGYERVIREHTYEKRFLEIFEHALKMS